MAEEWLVCSVRKAGATLGGTSMLLTELAGRFQNQWFTAADSQKREMLAVALASINMGRPVEVLVDLNVGTEIRGISVHAP